MSCFFRRGVAVALSAAIVLLSAPAPSYALFEWLWPQHWYQRETVSTCYTPPYSGRVIGYAPRYGALPWRAAMVPVPGYAAPAPTTCNYVPITCYRPEYRWMPTRAYQAVSYYQPCTGYPMVAYRPAVNWAYRPLWVPYNTYRIVYSAPVVGCASCAPLPACGACAACPTCGACAARPACGACASCGGAAPPAAVISPTPLPSLPPSSSTVLPAPSLPAPVSSIPQSSTGITLPGPPTTFASPPSSSPSIPGGGSSISPPGLLSPSPSTVPGSSTAPGTSPSPATPGTQQRIQPTPDYNTGPAPAKIPGLGAPQGRTAQATIRQAIYVRPVSYESQAGTPVRPRLDTSGWEAAGP